VTLKRLPQEGIDMRVVEVNGEVVPAMPKSLFTNDLWGQLMKMMTAVDEEGSQYLEHAFVTKMKVNSFPPKPSLTDLADMELEAEELEEVKEVLGQESIDGLQHVFPHAIIEPNIGSNKGLMDVLLEVSSKNKSGEANATRYQIYLTDVNIYHRINKVLIYIDA
jgi:hypothetical protein